MDGKQSWCCCCCSGVRPWFFLILWFLPLWHSFGFQRKHPSLPEDLEPMDLIFMLVAFANVTIILSCSKVPSFSSISVIAQPSERHHRLNVFGNTAVVLLEMSRCLATHFITGMLSFAGGGGFELVIKD